VSNQVVKPGAIVKEFRLDRGWNGAELARRAKMSPSQISKIEKGQENLKYPTLVKIAKALGIKPCVFLMVHEDREVFDDACGLRW
jgi:transcriptional regulator with XRE-family HTH domain